MNAGDFKLAATAIILLRRVWKIRFERKQRKLNETLRKIFAINQKLLLVVSFSSYTCSDD